MVRKSNDQRAEELMLCRELFMRLHGDDWKQRLKPYIVLVQQKMKADATNELEAAIDLSRDLTHGKDKELGYMAAAVELISRSEEFP